MKKLLHERLREWSESGERFALLAEREGYDGYWDFLSQLADEIEHDYIPRPRFEDGEPVEWFSEEPEWIDCGKFHQEEPWSVTAITPAGVPIATCFNKIVAFAALTDDGFVKRRKPKVLDADGVEIKKGETLWDDQGVKYSVDSINLNGDSPMILVSNDEVVFWSYATSRFTHKEPDSLQKVSKDLKEWCERGGWNGKIADISDRLTALIERVD